MSVESRPPVTDPALEALRAELERRSAGNWELYEKSAESLEVEATGAERVAAARRETGWAARWWEGDAPRFAAGSSPENLERAVLEASRVAPVSEPPPEWPTARNAVR